MYWLKRWYKNQANKFEENIYQERSPIVILSAKRAPLPSWNPYNFYFLVTNMQALGELLEKKQPWQKHCSNLHHWHLSPYLFRCLICSGRATVAQFSYILHIDTLTHIPPPPPFFFFCWWSCLSSVGVASVVSHLEIRSCRSACDDRNWAG